MHVFTSPWPATISPKRTPRARMRADLSPRDQRDLVALHAALDVQARQDALQCSGTTGTWSECMYSNAQDFAAYASSSTEGSLIAPGANEQPVIPALFFHNKLGRYRVLSLLARGVLSTTGTPTIIFQTRIGTTQGSSTLSGTSVGVTAAITTASGVTNKFWELRLDLVCTIPGLGTNNCTLAGAGFVTSPGGFASPFTYALEPSTPDTATWTATIDAALTQYVNLSATWSANSASNTITCKQLMLYGQN